MKQIPLTSPYWGAVHPIPDKSGVSFRIRCAWEGELGQRCHSFFTHPGTLSMHGRTFLSEFPFPVGWTHERTAGHPFHTKKHYCPIHKKEEEV